MDRGICSRVFPLPGVFDFYGTTFPQNQPIVVFAGISKLEGGKFRVTSNLPSFSNEPNNTVDYSLPLQDLLASDLMFELVNVYGIKPIAFEFYSAKDYPERWDAIEKIRGVIG